MVCRAWAQAVSHIPVLRRVLHLSNGDVRRIRWDAPLLLSLAPKITGVFLNGAGLRAPGLSTFLRAATTLTFIQAHTDAPLPAARLDFMLGSCTHITDMYVAGKSMPSHFPPSLQWLRAIPISGEYLPRDWVAVLVHHLAHLQHLRRLELSLDQAPVLLDCDMQLPHLKQLRIALILRSGKTFGLGWAKHQPCAELTVAIDMQSLDVRDSLSLTAELATVPITTLCLVCDGVLPTDVQQVWQALTIPLCKTAG